MPLSVLRVLVVTFQTVSWRQEASLKISVPDHPRSHSQLYTLRIWYEQLDAHDREVRVQVRHVLTGETRYFQGWALLTDYLDGMLKHPPAE